MAEAGSTPCSSRSARSCPSARTCPPARPRGSSTRSAAARRRRRRAADARPARRGLRRRQHRGRRRPYRPAAGRHRRDHRLPPDPRADAGARRGDGRGAGGGRPTAWLSTIAHADAGTVRVERMGLDDDGYPQPTGEFEELDADSVVLALGQEGDRSMVDGVPDIEVSTASSQVDDDLMTGQPGIFAGGDMVPAQRTVTVGVGHGKRAARGDRRVAAAAAVAGPSGPAGRRRLAEHLVLQRRAGHRTPPAGGRPPQFHVRRGRRAGWTPRPRSSRRGAACPAATASGATTATASARTTRSSSSAPGKVQDRPRLLQGLRHLRRRVPVGRDPHDARAEVGDLDEG